MKDGFFKVAQVLIPILVALVGFYKPFEERSNIVAKYEYFSGFTGLPWGTQKFLLLTDAIRQKFSPDQFAPLREKVELLRSQIANSQPLVEGELNINLVNETAKLFAEKDNTPFLAYYNTVHLNITNISSKPSTEIEIRFKTSGFYEVYHGDDNSPWQREYVQLGEVVSLGNLFHQEYVNIWYFPDQAIDQSASPAFINVQNGSVEIDHYPDYRPENITISLPRFGIRMIIWASIAVFLMIITAVIVRFVKRSSSRQ